MIDRSVNIETNTRDEGGKLMALSVSVNRNAYRPWLQELSVILAVRKTGENVGGYMVNIALGEHPSQTIRQLRDLANGLEDMVKQRTHE
jgi:hypothetical protein